MDKLKQKFHQLSEREQRLMLISAVAIAIGAFYWLVWAPLNTSLAQERIALENQQSLLSWVEKNANKVIQLRGSGKASASFNGSLPQAVNRSADKLGIAISRMQPQAEELQVWVDQAPFNDVLAWLQELEDQGIVILDLDVAEADVPGYVKIRRLQLGKA